LLYTCLLQQQKQDLAAVARMGTGPSVKDDVHWREFGPAYWYFPSQNS
jgi:hypothetical protein